MVEVLVIVYSMLMFFVFKVLKVPLNKWTGTTAVLGGVVSIGFLLLMMGMYHPFTKEARIYTLTTPVLTTVKGRIIEVNVRTGDRVKAGESLFQIDPEPFQYHAPDRVLRAPSPTPIPQSGGRVPSSARTSGLLPDTSRESFARGRR